MKTNLIIVEGLPGSGKSTTASMIAGELTKKGKQVVCVDEGAAEHPADIADYDFPDFETERARILEKWRSFVNGADEDVIYVFNCIFLQNPMCETMMRFGMEEEASANCIAEIAEIIKPMSPVIVYIDQPNVRSAIDSVLAERGNGWMKAVTEYHVSQGYGKQNRLSGYDGYIKCLEERRIRERNILCSLNMDCYTISQDITADELAELFSSVGWSLPAREQMELAVNNSTKSFVVRHKGKAVAAINWLGDYGMHWFMKDFIIHKDYQGQMIGTFLYRFSENFIKSTIQDGWKVCIDLRSSKGKETFYNQLGFETMTADDSGSGMEKMLER
ncbi:GNAT family N-acetyltransferase [Clostridium sp. chh4-2]|uniref:GNAT family N-acetyltransferase n=1 Tax=Clostridium sp. chh4-2 TaxID=2067550 RepID=UPI000CCEBBD9|nr:GNAT family N-acetyltransferase [Clostridium sp. chh4-2]PNV63498.1 GNAT family N-acetyltransferase [Clostridium sp. chh4-2]